MNVAPTIAQVTTCLADPDNRVKFFMAHFGDKGARKFLGSRNLISSANQVSVQDDRPENARAGGLRKVDQRERSEQSERPFFDHG